MRIQGKKKIVTATLIVNPVSGVGDPRERRKKIVKIAKENGWVGEYIETTKTKSAGDIAKREVGRGVKHIIVCGGDGTVMEVLEAIVGKKVALGIVPLGTGNLLARNLSLPLDIEESLKVALFGNHQKIDVGVANGTYFGVIAGIGLDAEVVQAAKREMKDKWGILAYVFTTIKSLSNRTALFEITLDKKKKIRTRAKSVMAANMGKLVGGVALVPSTHPRSGTLQLGIVKARGMREWLSVFLHALRGKIGKSPHYDVYTASHIEIRVLNGKKFYECDGNHFLPTDHLVIKIFHNDVTVIVSPDVLAKKKGDKVLLFDFDGTVADSLEMVVRVYNTLADKYNYPHLTAQKREDLRGMSARDVIKNLPIPSYRLPLYLNEGRKLFKEHIEDLKPFPQLSEALKLLSTQYALGIVTSNEPELVKKFLLKHHIDYFAFVYSDGSIFGKGKVMKNVIRKYKFNAKNVLYVGDEVRDIDAARDAGLRVASVTWGFNSKEILRQNRPDFVIDTPLKLASLDLFKE